MSEEETAMEIEDKSEKVSSKKKVRKRKSKIDDEEFVEEVKAQRKTKKIKVEPIQNSSLLKWLNTSTEKPQASGEMSKVTSLQGSSKNEDILDVSNEIIENQSDSKSGSCSNSLQISSPNSKSSPAIVNELLAKIDFSNLKSKLKTKLSLSPKSSLPKNPQGNNMKSIAKDVTSANKKKSVKNTKLDDKETESKVDSKVSVKEKAANKSIQEMFERMKKTKAEINRKLGSDNNSEESEIDDEDDEFLAASFADSDDGEMIFLSNKNVRQKVVDSTDNESVDSFVKTPSKNTELMAPPYSPLSPMCKKSLRQSPNSKSQQKSSPLPKCSPGKSKKDQQKSNSSPVHKQSSRDQCSKSPRDDSLSNKETPSPKKYSKNLFGKLPLSKPTELTSVDLKEEISNDSNIKNSNNKKKSKRKSRNEIHSPQTNNQESSDEDFKTPKRKSKPGRKKKETDGDTSKQEKVAKETKIKKKESPNLNSSLLNYFKKVDKEVQEPLNSSKIISSECTSDKKSTDDDFEKVKSKKKKNNMKRDDEMQESKEITPTGENSSDEIGTNDDVSVTAEKQMELKECDEISAAETGEINTDNTETNDITENFRRGKKKKTKHKDKKPTPQDEASKVTPVENNLVVLGAHDTSTENIVQSKKKKKKKHKKKQGSCVEIRFDFESDTSIDQIDNTLDNPSISVNDVNLDTEKEYVPEEVNVEKPNEDINVKSEKLYNKEETHTENPSGDVTVLENSEKNMEVEDADTKEIDFPGSGNKEDDRKEELNEATTKKRGRRRSKKGKIETEITEVEDNQMETVTNEHNEEESQSKSEEVNEDKENKRTRRTRERKSKEKKELQEHCDNVDEEGVEDVKKPEETVSLFKYFKKVDSIVETGDKSNNLLKVSWKLGRKICLFYY